MGFFDVLSSSFGSGEKRCILCGKAAGTQCYPVANRQVLCDRCAMECGYENTFFLSVPVEQRTKEKIERDWGLHDLRIQKNKDAYRAFKASLHFDRKLYLDGERLCFYAPSVVLSNSRTPIVYSYHQVRGCRILLQEGVRTQVLFSTEPNFEPKILPKLPIVEGLLVEIETDDLSHPFLRLQMMDEPDRKNSRAYDKAAETAKKLFDWIQAILANR